MRKQQIIHSKVLISLTVLLLGFLDAWGKMQVLDTLQCPSVNQMLINQCQRAVDLKLGQKEWNFHPPSHRQYLSPWVWVLCTACTANKIFAASQKTKGKKMGMGEITISFILWFSVPSVASHSPFHCQKWLQPWPYCGSVQPHVDKHKSDYFQLIFANVRPPLPCIIMTFLAIFSWRESAAKIELQLLICNCTFFVRCLIFKVWCALIGSSSHRK